MDDGPFQDWGRGSYTRLNAESDELPKVLR